MKDITNTQFFQVETGPQIQAKDILEIVYNALVEKGYNPVNQIVGYIMSGDPTYITSYNGARSLVMKVERDEIVEELLKAYIRHELSVEDMMRIMGLDYGTKTVGVAVSDPLGITAQAVETVTRKDENKLRKTLARIESLATEYGVEKFVIGFPKHMNNDIGERAEKALEFGEMLKRRTGIEIVMWDERLTTVEAERTLMESGVRRENRKQYVDQIAAVFILQGYLDSLGMQK